MFKDREETAQSADAKVHSARRRRENRRKALRIDQEWSRERRLRELRSASGRMTDEIATDHAQAQALTRSRAQAVEGHLISQEELDRVLQDDDE
jgi:hypothetical protein